MKVEYKQSGESYHIQQYFSSANERTNTQNTKRNIKQKMEKWYGRITADKIQEVQLNLKQELRVESEKF